ncbi:MAG: NfeD family protein [Bacillota bacterium]|nr:NfeD family protein [Bacillota bacterium]
MEAYMPLIWIGLAVFFAICEAFSFQFICIWFVFGSLMAALSCIWFNDNLYVQVGAFTVISVVSLIATRPACKRLMHEKMTRTNSDRYIGEIGIVKTEINNDLGQGLVTVKGSIWTGRSADGSVIPTGTSVKVQDIEGVKLIVSAEAK